MAHWMVPWWLIVRAVVAHWVAHIICVCCGEALDVILWLNTCDSVACWLWNVIVHGGLLVVNTPAVMGSNPTSHYMASEGSNAKVPKKNFLPETYLLHLPESCRFLN